MESLSKNADRSTVKQLAQCACVLVQTDVGTEETFGGVPCLWAGLGGVGLCRDDLHHQQQEEDLSSLHSFVTQGCSEVAAKLAVIEDHLKPISVYQTTPSTPRQACSSHISTWLWLFLKSVMRIQIVGWWHCLSTPLSYASLYLWCSPSQSAPTAPLAAMSLTR